MWAFLPIVQNLLLAAISRKSKQDFHLNLTGLGLAALSGCTAVLGVIFLFLALQSFIAEIYGEWIGWLVVSATAFVLTAIALVTANISKRKEGLVKQAKSNLPIDSNGFQEFVQEMAQPIKEHPVAAVLLASVAGILAGEKIGEKYGENTKDKNLKSSANFLNKIISELT